MTPVIFSKQDRGGSSDILLSSPFFYFKTISAAKFKGSEELLQLERELYLDMLNYQPAGVYRIRVFPKALISKLHKAIEEIKTLRGRGYSWYLSGMLQGALP